MMKLMVLVAPSLSVKSTPFKRSIVAVVMAVASVWMLPTIFTLGVEIVAPLATAPLGPLGP